MVLKGKKAIFDWLGGQALGWVSLYVVDFMGEKYGFVAVACEGGFHRGVVIILSYNFV